MFSSSKTFQSTWTSRSLLVPAMKRLLATSAASASQRIRPPRMVKHTVSPILTVPSHIDPPEYFRTGRPGQSPDYIELYGEEHWPELRQAARLARKMLEFALNLAQPGITTDEIDRLTHQEIVKHKAYPSPLNYHGFPKSICTSVNDVICHGIPDGYRLQEGDVISVDVSVFLDGYHGDNCGAKVVGKNVDPDLERLVSVTRDSVLQAIDICKPGTCITEIGRTLQTIATRNGYGVVSHFCGHGVGRLLHMQPLIQHVANHDRFDMVPGMVFTIEPIFVEGKGDITTWKDGWTAATKDGGRGAQFEHEILITETGAEILTVLE